MTPSQLKAAHESANPDSNYFDRKTMRFFGDTMANYAVSRDPVPFVTHSGERLTAWELRRKRPVKERNQSPAYFCTETFRRLHGKPNPTAV